MGTATWIRLAVAPVDAGIPYVTLFPALALSAIIGGYRAGLLATAIGLVIVSWIFTPPYYSVSLEALRASFWSNMVFLADGLIVSLSIEAMHRFGHRYQRELAESRESEARTIDLNRKLESVVAELEKAKESLTIAATAFQTYEAIVITDADANIIRVNQAFERITGYSEAEVLGKNPRTFSSGRHDKDFYARMWQALRETGTWNGELWDRHKNGSIYPKEMTINAVRNAQENITHYVAVFTDISERKRTEEEIHSLAFYDALTQLPNRRLLFNRFSHLLARPAKTPGCGALLFLDIDKFKMLNDTLGHEMGDCLLVEVSRRLSYCVRSADTVARFAGDEFVVLLGNVGATTEEALSNTLAIAETIRATLATPYQLKENRFLCSCSIGACLFGPEESSIDELIKRADTAMYEAKNGGGNKICFYDPQLQTMAQSRAALEADLRQAIPNRQLRLFYQVQINDRNIPVGAEALVRWLHPERGMVPPGQFIPIAEESSIILDLGYWILEEACHQLALWSENPGTRAMTLAVNVSAQQFRQADFAGQVSELLQKYRVDPARLKLELTETVALNDLNDVVSKMAFLRDVVGVALSLDDFGTGYSSLSYLKKLPIDQIKIDQSFVRDITTSPSDAVMVKTIVDLAKNFGLDVIAEGVETGAQLDMLKSIGCTMFQGYLFSRPIPAADFEPMLTAFCEPT